MLCKRFSHLIQLFTIVVFSLISSGCGQGDGPTPVAAEACPAAGAVGFDSDSYPESTTLAVVSVADECIGLKTVVVTVNNGTDTISVDLDVEAGQGENVVKFGDTDDTSNTIAIKQGDVLTATYADANGVASSDTADITVSTALSTLGVYSETNVNPELTVAEIINNEALTDRFGQTVTALEGVNSLQADFSVPSSGNENGFAFTFFGLINATFEADDASAGNVRCNDGANLNVCTGWTTFEFAFTNNTAGPAFGPVSHDAGGSQSLTMFGPFTFDSSTGAYQPDNNVVAGQSYTATAHVMNWAPDPLATDNIGIMQLTFWDAAGGQAGGGTQIGPAFELLVDSTDDSTNIYLPPQDGADISDWTELTITQTAPAGTVSAEIFLLHIQLNTDPLLQAGSIFWDDVSLAGAKDLSGAGEDISTYETLKFGINTTAASGLMDLEVKMEDNTGASASVFLSNYTSTPGAIAGWDLYEIPLADFAGPNKARMISLDFLNASSTETGSTAVAPTLFATTLYFDDVHFAKPDAAPVLTGVLLNSAIEGVTFETATQSGVTNANGEFQYLDGEMVTFSVGGIVLGTVEGAAIITPVELTGGADPLDQAATNQLVFLQSIDADADYSNGITISAATQAAAVGQTLDFTLSSADFTTAVTAVVAAIAPANTVVSETSALDNFYITYTTLGGSDTFSWSFPPQYPPYPGVASFPVDFEDAGAPYYFTDFGGGVATIIGNPDASGINTSAKVAQMQKFAGDDFGGSTLTLGTIDFANGSIFTMKVWASRSVPVTFKLEGLNVEQVVSHSGSGTWEELAFDFTGLTGPDVREVTLIFDNGNAGDAAGDAPNWTFYFDDINLQTTNPSAYELIWSDEFDVDGVPAAQNWIIETGYGPNNDGWGNNEWQLYTASPDNVKVASGNLVLTADCPTAPTCGVRDDTITSGKVSSPGKFSFKYGKVEAKIKPPVGNGAWPAFWMLGANFPDVGWPFTGEIDVMEMHNAFSDEFTTHFTMHWCDETKQSPATPDVCFPDNEGWTFVSQFLTFSESLGDDYHIFSAEWDSNGIAGFIDGIEYFNLAIDPGTMDEFLKEFYLILNVAMGGTLGSNNAPPDGSETWPQTMLVDYVRVYQLIGGDGTYTIGGTPLEPLGVYSETNIDPVLAYSEIINVADFGGKNTLTNENSTDVALEGFVSLKANYISTGPGADYNGFVFNFGSAGGGGGTNLLTNGSFESPDASAGDIACSDSWSCFNASFTTSNNFMPGGGFVNPTAHSGSQVLKQYGSDGGATQKVAAAAGDTVNASVYAMNWLGDPFNNLALLQIAYLDASGGVISVEEIFADTAGNQAYQLLPQDGGEVTDWTLMEVSGVAPAGTVEAQILLLHIDIGQGGGSIFWDDASLSTGASAPAIPAADISGYEALKFGINTSSASGFKDLEVKMETSTGVGSSVFLSNYTPTPTVGQNGDWFVYEIPLLEFIDPVALDLTDIVYLGFWNASSELTGSTSVPPTLLDGTLYFDDIHFGPSTSGSVNLLTNTSFESPDASAGDIACSDSWSCFNASFTTSNNFLPGGGFVNPTAHSGSQVLKQYGSDGGATQKVAAAAGDTVNASVYAMSWLGDPFNNLALLQIAYLDASGGVISVEEIFADTAGNQAYQLLPQDGGEVTDWTLMEISGVAPAGTVEAQILLLHIDIGQGGGSIFWDDASLSIGTP